MTAGKKPDKIGLLGFPAPCKSNASPGSCGYVHSADTGLYYLQSRYYAPEIGRFINADAFASTGQGVLGNNMFAYCNNNPVNFADAFGCRPSSTCARTTMTEGSGCLDYGPNIEFLMAFFGVASPSDVPDLPEGAMIFVENFTCITICGVTVIEGRTIVFDKNKYCEYYFAGIGVGAAETLPIDKVITQGYVYGVNDIFDYCGEFWGLSFYCAATATGGAYAFGGVRAEITGGIGTSVSLGVCRTYYTTKQSGWIYGKANLTIVTVPSHQQYLPGNGSVTV